MMDCSKARRALWPPEKPKLAEAAVLKAREHVEACVACRSYFDQDRHLLDAYARVRSVQAPRRIRERVLRCPRSRASAESGPPGGGSSQASGAEARDAALDSGRDRRRRGPHRG